MTRLLRAPLVAALLLGATAAPGAAQSLFASRGLGLPVEPQSARSSALGGVGLGLPGYEISWSNPAGAVGIPVPGLLVSFQTDDFSARYGERTSEGQTARFPLLMGAFPFGEKWAVTAGFGGFLDQRWAVEQADTVRSTTDTTAVLDRAASDGGVSRLRLGAAYRVLPRLSVGAGLDLFTGGVQRVTGRIFPDEGTPGCCTSEWSYSGLGLMGSVDWNPAEALSISASASLGSTLKATPRDSVATGARFDVPAMLNVGASARVSPSTLLAASAEWAGWAASDAALRSVGGARDAWAVRGGLEWEALEVAGRVIPIRLGGRYRTLPFRWGTAEGDADWASEQAFTGGTGLVLAGGATRAELSLERGRRGEPGDGLYETFTRIIFSVSVLGQ